MGGFEHIFSFLGLLLGFTLVEVLGGFIRTTKHLRVRYGGQSPVRMGWMTPLLALFVVMDVASYWAYVWYVAKWIPVGLDSILLGLAMAGGYYFAASMVFPDHPSEWPDLDRWFWLHKRQVLGPIFVINLTFMSIYILMHLRMSPVPMRMVDAILGQGMYFLCLGTAFFERRRWPVVMALGLLILLFLLEAAVQLAGHFR